jgi:hypothetical protein
MPNALPIANNHAASTRLDAHHARAADNLRTGVRSHLEQHLIKPVPRQARRREWQIGDGMAFTLDQAKERD